MPHPAPLALPIIMRELDSETALALKSNDKEGTSPFAPFPFPFDLPLFPLPLPLCESVQMSDVFRPYFHAWQVSDVCPGFPQ